MRAVLIIPKGLQEGNLIWMPPYIYPEDHLETGIQELKDKGYTIEKIEDQSGLAFASLYTASEMQVDFEVAFRWMSIVFYNDENKIDFKKDILNYAIIVLPLARLEIYDSIITSEMCV